MERSSSFTLLVLAAVAAYVSAAPIAIPSSNVDSVPSGTRYMGPQDPTNGAVPVEWELLGGAEQFPMVAIHMVQVPNTDYFVYVQKASPTNLGSPDLERVAGRINPFTKEWENTTALNSNAFCGGNTLSSNGHPVHVGGHGGSLSGLRGGGTWIRMYYKENNSYPDVTKMMESRWYPTATLMPNKKVFIIGGTTASNEKGPETTSYEIFDPLTPATRPEQFQLEPAQRAYVGKHYYPFTYVLPTGHIFSLIDRQSRFFTQDGEYVRDANGDYLAAPETPGGMDTGFPRSATSVLLPIKPVNGEVDSAEIVVFGGQKAGFECPHVFEIASTTFGSRKSYRLKISWTKSDNGDYTYSFDDWVEEDMGLHRVGGDTILLPNGDTMLFSGAQTGCMGGTINGINRANWPNLWPELYQYEKPAGSRYTILKASPIARVYHQSSALTTDGSILVAGCDFCGKRTLESPGDFWSPPPNKNEMRSELFHTPYSLDTENRPTIVSVKGTNAGGDVNLGYDEEFDIVWGTTEDVSSVTLVAPSASTHGYNTNQRVVFLEIVNKDAGSKTITVKSPAYANLAPPQYYMLFVNNVKTYSKAQWVLLDTAN